MKNTLVLLAVVAAIVFGSSSGTLLAADMDRLAVQRSLGLTKAPRGQTGTAPEPATSSSKQEFVEGSEAEPSSRYGNSAELADYSANRTSTVFGANLFTGAFAKQGPTQFNPDYLIAIGDRIHVRMWGAFDFDQELVVDAKGNIFIPHAGPVQVVGMLNHKLQRLVEAAIKRTFRNNVYSYASLAGAQPVRVFVAGYVSRPGLYNGTSMDSLLHYLDQAGGIDPDRGSFLNVQVKRGRLVRAEINLYDFLLEGRIPQLQLSDGDVLFVGPRQNTVVVTGLAESAKRFEFSTPVLTIPQLSRLSKPRANATHVRVVRNSGTVRNIDYYALANAPAVAVGNGDEVEFTADKKPGTITVRVEGEHLSAQEYVLPHGARLGDLMKNISFSERSESSSVQLFRQSVRQRQKEMLQVSMRSLESSVLTARSGTSDEATLRKEEADLILRWVDRARNIEPTGQVLIAESSSRNELLLENGDIIKVPTRDGLVLVSGEVLFPNAIAFEQRYDVEEYIQRAGGYTQNADSARVVVAHRDGSFGEGRSLDAVRAGDEILVLPRIDVKSRQIWKDLTQTLFQIAISAKVVLGL